MCHLKTGDSEKPVESTDSGRAAGVPPGPRPRLRKDEGWESADACKTQAPKAPEPGTLVSNDGREGCLVPGDRVTLLPFHPHFAPSGVWMMPTHTGKGEFSLLSLLISLPVSMETASWTEDTPEIATWASLSPGKLMHKINHCSVLQMELHDQWYV